MDLFTTFDIAASGLKAQTTRLNTISSNLANAETTSTPEGGPYKKKSVVFQSQDMPFNKHLQKSLYEQGQAQGRGSGENLGRRQRSTTGLRPHAS